MHSITDISRCLSSRQTITISKTYSNCSCDISKSCRSSVSTYSFDEQLTMTILYSIPNFFVGCYPIESLLASILECFYNRSWMIELDQYMGTPLGNSFNFSTLDPDWNSPYEKIESIISRLMIDSWSSSVSFTSYYETCAPWSCTFEYEGRDNLLVVITTIISVFGGLSLACKIIILIALRIIEKFMDGLIRRGLMLFIKNLFICNDESKKFVDCISYWS